MAVVVTAADRASFSRCRRQWDFGAGMRQDLEPARRPALPDLDRAVRDALAVYYFPGMWDWDRAVRLPLVGQELHRALDRQRKRTAETGSADDGRWQEALDEGNALLARYLNWAPRTDRFAPVLVETDFEVNVLDPQRPDAALTAGRGEPIRYSGRIDMMAVDQHDAYWIVRHRVVDADWLPTEQLLADEEALTACWAWEQFYLGMAITGTIHNELRPGPSTHHRQRRRWLRPRMPTVRHHEPSGGGRSIPQHRRMYAQATQPARVEPVEQVTRDGFRRTWLRRTPADVAAAGQRLGRDVAEMARGDLAVYPEPDDRKCAPCPFRTPCQAMQGGRDEKQILRTDYRKRPPELPEEGRLGGRAWGMGRGAAPPKFPGRQRAAEDYGGA
jgi:PD-(D/E)XK nuclease superfamily